MNKYPNGTGSDSRSPHAAGPASRDTEREGFSITSLAIFYKQMGEYYFQRTMKQKLSWRLK